MTFVHSTPPSSDELDSDVDVDMKTPISGSPTPMSTSGMATDAHSSTPSPCPLSEVRWNPAPRHVTETEVAVLEGCLRRWRQEMEQDVKGRALKWSNIYFLLTVPLHREGDTSCE